MINQQNMKVKNGSTWHTICPFPVGFIYLAATSTSPGTTFGGTWAALSSGYFLRPAGTFSGTGGEASHKLVTNEMPVHNHAITVGASGGSTSQGTNRILYNSVFIGDGSLSCNNAGGGHLTTICRLTRTCLDGEEPHRKLVV